MKLENHLGLCRQLGKVRRTLAKAKRSLANYKAHHMKSGARDPVRWSAKTAEIEALEARAVDLGRRIQTSIQNRRIKEAAHAQRH